MEISKIVDEIKQNKTVLFLGMEIFKESICSDGTVMPHDSNSFILSINNQKPMAPRLMYEYPRAFMNIEQKKGRNYLEELVEQIYTKKEYNRPKIYNFVEKIMPKYIIDTNIDDNLQKIYANIEHFLVLGCARVIGDYNRFEIFYNDLNGYKKVDFLDISKPIIFKPMGSIKPIRNLVISDADFVDWMTEAFGGFAVPKEIKEYRVAKKYLFLGLRFLKDTQRIVANEITLNLSGGYVLLNEEPTKSELRFIKSHNLEIIKCDIDTFLNGVEV